MAFDLTIGEVKKILQLTLQDVNSSVSPPVVAPLNLMGATVTLQYAVGTLYRETVVERTMVIVDAPNGVVQYTFVSGDLVKPADFGTTGQFQFVVKVTYPDGRIL